jgi:hypothetical protein
LRSMENLTPYLDSESKSHRGIDITVPIMLGRSMATMLEESSTNPWAPDRAPILPLPHASP